MGKNTAISWTHHSFNPWWGCTEVSPGCDLCYARGLAERFGFDLWGKGADRRFFGDKYWQEPVGWNRAAARAGERHRIFVASMSDILEQRTDAMGNRMAAERERLWTLIADTPWLDWLLLSKRPQGFRRTPAEILALPNVWPGTSVELAEYLWRAEELLTLRCAGPRWVSYEPALGPVDFSGVLGSQRIEWLVVGGESDRRGRWRQMDLAWLASAVAQADHAGIAPYVKQDCGSRDGLQGQIPDHLWSRKEFPRERR